MISDMRRFFEKTSETISQWKNASKRNYDVLKSQSEVIITLLKVQADDSKSRL